VSLGQSNGTFGQWFVGLDNGFTVSDGGWTSFDQYPRQLGDVNGDGRDDIVGFGGGEVYVSLGQSNGTFGQWFVGLDNGFTVSDGGWTSFNQYPRQLGDINGDGRNDIVGFGGGEVYVSLA
ncbi:MAG: VCBS repeat-containing protein, partial [Nostoc sp.]|uniref:FG-GAP repeat domain-containing protein n=1 Tax=Nostoc sp. TaxID=1180 RepID=UPI002FF90FDF